MRNEGFLKMKTDVGVADEVISGDLKQLGDAAKRLAKHAIKLGASFGVGSTIVQAIASIAAIYLLILDRTNWRTNILTSLLIPYVYLSLPSVIFNLFRGDLGRWLSFIGVVMKLFFHRHFPVTLELLVSLILLIVVSPTFIAHTIRGSLIGVFIFLVIACYLLQEHIRSAGGFKNAFTKSNGISNSVGIIILLIHPIWSLVVYFLYTSLLQLLAYSPSPCCCILYNKWFNFMHVCKCVSLHMYSQSIGSCVSIFFVQFVFIYEAEF
uniref:Stress-regulated protein SAP1 n=1 Tax=Xerophyta viscosa TaxID=90708 RepID=Q8L8H1_9LILI|nr:stress-regulated protein SAP1 [Xerophyta viscosa]